MKSIIFCDIDGTIIDGSRDMHELSFKTRYAIDELKKDNYVFIASGRCKGLLDKAILDLNPSGFILCNGAYAEVDNKTIHSVYFDDDDINMVKKIVDDNDGFYILETLNETYVDSFTKEAFKVFLDGWGMALDYFIEDPNPREKLHISMIGFKDTKTNIEIIPLLKEYADVLPHPSYISSDVNIKGINKGVAVKKVIEYLNIPYENTYCFGDGINDLEMLEAVNHPVIMKNCDPKLRTYGFEETDDVLHDGFYNYLVNNKLIKPL